MKSRLHDFISRFIALFQRKRLEQRLQEELDFHLEMQVEENLKNGMKPDEARNNALIVFGGIDKTKEEYRETARIFLLEEIWRDFCYSVRQLKRSPGFTLVAVLLLALGIGANTAIFSFIDTVVFRPLPVYEPDRLMTDSQDWSLTDCEDVKLDDKIFSDITAFLGIGLLARDENYTLLTGRGVTANFFQVLGLHMAAGRGFLTDEGSISGDNQVVIISHRYWQQVFQCDPAAIGKSIELNKVPLTIVGVAPENFRGLTFAGSYQDIWVPIPTFLTVQHIPGDQLRISEDQVRTLDSRDLRGMSVIGRLKDGVSSKQANVRMKILADELREAYPDTNRNWHPQLILLNRARDPGQGKFSLAILAVAGICILLIACTNVAGLLLARGSARRQEIAVRSALGANQSRVIRQLIIEGFTLTVPAIVISLAVCGLTLKILPLLQGTLDPSLPLGVQTFGIPNILELTFDRRVLAFAIAIGLCTNLLFALAPALVLSKSDIHNIAKLHGSFGFDRIRSRWRRMLVTLQIALSVILLITAGLFAKTTLHYKRMDTGYDRESLILMADFLALGRSPGLEFHRQSLERINEIPGVRSAAWAGVPPLVEQGYYPDQIRRDLPLSGDDSWLEIEHNSISSGYFETVGIPVLQGRDFTDFDDEKSPRVVIVNETLAHKYWPGASPLGKRILVRNRSAAKGQPPGEFYEVIGMVRNVIYDSLDERSEPYIYYSYAQKGLRTDMILHVSAFGDPRSLIVPVRKACEEINPYVGIGNTRLMADQLDKYFVRERSAAFILGILGPLALVLAAVGLYGVISYSVIQRLPELGIRMALGASRTAISKMIVREALVLALGGLSIGVSFSMVLSRLIAGRLHGINPLDPATYVLVSILCLSVAFAAGLLPALRAGLYTSNPLRTE